MADGMHNLKQHFKDKAINTAMVMVLLASFLMCFAALLWLGKIDSDYRARIAELDKSFHDYKRHDSLYKESTFQHANVMSGVTVAGFIQVDDSTSRVYFEKGLYLECRGRGLVTRLHASTERGVK